MMKCPAVDCDKSYKNKKGVAIHWGHEHSGPLPLNKHDCDYCGGSFTRPESEVRNGTKFCDRECYSKYRKENEWRESNKERFVCDECGCEFDKWPNRRSGKHTFCSPECYYLWRSINEKTDYGVDWEEKRKRAIKRDRGRCTYEGCQKRECDHGVALHVHHIKPLRTFDKDGEAHKLENLRTVCAQHHRKIERKIQND